jgi:hypothetical protein
MNFARQKAAQFAAEAASGDLRRSSLNAFVDLVQDAADQLVKNLGRSAERIQSFKQVALDQGQSNRRSFDAGALAEQVLSHLTRDQQTITLNFHCERGLVMDSWPLQSRHSNVGPDRRGHLPPASGASVVRKEIQMTRAFSSPTHHLPQMFRIRLSATDV